MAFQYPLNFFIMKTILSILAWIVTIPALLAQNPLIMDQFTADPSARVFNDRVYVFPSHDIPAPEGKGLREDWFCMEDYHVFSSENLTQWIDHGMIVSQYDADWVDSTSYSMWAPDCIERNGKYYFYYPANTKNVGPNGRKGFGIGVAIADNPEGPYVVEDEPIEGIFGIDPNILIDNDGQAYIYWSMGDIFVAKLKDNMLELASEPHKIENLPSEGLKEGPWVFKRNGTYYLTFPHVENKTERLEYAVGDNPMGPFEMKGVIMDESPTGCWTNHHSIIEYNDQWYLFYHHNDLSPHFDKNRSIRSDSLFFNTDGTIRKVTPTLRGVGITRADKRIQIDRYSDISGDGVKTAFIDTLDTHKGWKVTLSQKGEWVRYNKVDFNDKNYKVVGTKVMSPTGSRFEIRLDAPDGDVLATVDMKNTNDWAVENTRLKNSPTGVHDLFVVSDENTAFSVDWIKFE